VAGLERRLNAALARLRQAYSKLPDIDGHTLDDIQQIVDFAIRVERCGDVFAGKYLDLRLMQVQGEYSFSPEGEAEIAELVDAVRRANILAQETSWTGNVSSAQRLVRHKQDVAELESRSRSNHLARLRRGNLISLGSSDQHLEMIAALKEVNSKFATIGYAVLERHGGLKKSRLKSPSQVSSPGGF
jgi:phosphate:Na+ symporter